MSRWVLVGREEELALLRAALADVTAQGVVLSGGPGVGKTRLAAELLEYAAKRGWATQWVIGTRGTAGVPLGAFTPLLPRGDLADLVGTAAPGSLDALQRVGDELRRGSDGRPIVVVVDDAHLLDDASAALTRLLVSRIDTFVVATVRPEERIPDAISALWQDGLVTRVEVPALTRAQVGQLLGAVLGGQLDTAMAYRLWDASRGDVLFLHELVVTGLDCGALRERFGVWSWTGELICSDRLTELVEDQLAGLSGAQRSALEVLAVGEPVPSAEFGSLVGVRVAQELDERGLLATGHHGRRSLVRLAHPLYAATVRAGVGAVRRRTIHRRLADVLTATGAHRREDALRAALWRFESGGPADPAVLVAGARRALAVFDHQLAERLARAAVGEHDGIDARITLATALYWQGRYGEAGAVVLDRPPPGTTAAVAADWARIASAIFFWGFGDAQRAEELLRSAEQTMPPGPHHDLLLAQRATLAFFHGRPADALALAEPLLTRESPGDLAVVTARVAAVPSLAMLGRCQAAVRLADEGMQAGLRLLDDEPQLVGALLAVQAVACWRAGRYAQLEDLATAAYQQMVAAKAHDLHGVWAALLGRAALATGRIVTARARLREASALLRRHDPGGVLGWVLGASALAAALLGDAGEAAALLTEQRADRLSVIRIFDWETVLAQAWTAAARGEHSAARGLACRAADVAAAGGLRSAELDALHDAVRLGEMRVVPRLVALAASVDSLLAPVLAAHAHALAAADAVELDRCATRFAELGALLLAAEAAAEAAEQYHRSGRPAARLTARQRSRNWASHCEGAQPPSLRRAGDPPALEALTTREREIAELAARGLLKREIADRLTLSVRTVGNHLNHIYAKAGISGRAELTLLLGPRPPDTPPPPPDHPT